MATEILHYSVINDQFDSTLFQDNEQIGASQRDSVTATKRQRSLEPTVADVTKSEPNFIYVKRSSVDISLPCTRSIRAFRNVLMQSR